LNSREVIKALAEKMDIPQNEAGKLLKQVVLTLGENFAKGMSFTFQNFGTFQVRKVESRKAYSPVLKEYVLAPPKRILDFHPSKPIKEKFKNINLDER
jgi:DNA-binding protein HU-beta